jgi:hypothetical protein
MTRLFLIIVMITQLGCAELIGFGVGTASNVTGDLIIRYIEDEKPENKQDNKEEVTKEEMTKETSGGE